MQQEVLRENKEIEFILCPNKKYKCQDCQKEFSHIERCRDKVDRCKNCKRKMITNPFYNPDWGKKRDFVGVKNLSGQEYNMLIKKYQKKGYNYLEAKQKVEYELSIVRHQKITKVSPECLKSPNLDIKIEEKSQLNKILVEGLGMKRR